MQSAGQGRWTVRTVRVKRDERSGRAGVRKGDVKTRRRDPTGGQEDRRTGQEDRTGRRTFEAITTDSLRETRSV